MKILLTAINAKYIHSNLAICSLRAYANRYAGEIRIKEYTINQPLDGILMDLYEEKPDVICFSCYLWNIICVEQLLAEIPKVLPDTRLWLGGPEVSWNAVEILKRYPAVEGVMCGEGEETFLELTDYFHGCGRELSDIRGIAYRLPGQLPSVTGSRPACWRRSWADLRWSHLPFWHCLSAWELASFFRKNRLRPASGRNRPLWNNSRRSRPKKCLPATIPW